MPTYGERGYLKENFRLFHLAAPLTEEVDFHYHTFHKIVIPLKGTLSYMIEGRHYRLEAYDVALVGRGCVHKPETAESNERVLIYISSDFLREKSTDTCDLEMCYKIAHERGSHILRLNHLQRNRVSRLIGELENLSKSEEYGSDFMRDTILFQLMIELAGFSLKQQNVEVDTVFDEKIVQILKYINDNLTENISIDNLAEKIYISKYHMMRKFKAETGYTVHVYISNKRLLLSQQLIEQGMSPTDACYRCGFRDYSVYSKAYKKLFGVSPKKK
ncbi:MAG: helix-turn-helix domain-containing protein [Clostridia bacterium]|nr:helix-turn-helix domain-containing protein [Clostridia bacterium]